MIEDWIRIGGAQTLMSYGLAPDLTRDGPASILRDLIRAMPGEHLEFLDDLRLSYTCGDFFFVHAGVRPGVPLAEQREHDLLWIREEFLRSEERFGKYMSMVPRRFVPPKSWRIATMSIPVPTRRAI